MDREVRHPDGGMRPSRRGNVTVRDVAGRVHKDRPSSSDAPPAVGNQPRTSLAPTTRIPDATTTAVPEPTRTSIPIGWASDDSPEIEPSEPNASVAVGPDHVVHAVDSVMRIARRDGSSPIAVTFDTLFGLGGQYPNEGGRVIFDGAHQRWVATETSWDCFPGPGASVGHGYLDFAISRSADPTGVWDIYYFTFANRLPTLVRAGTSTDKLAFATWSRPNLPGCASIGGYDYSETLVLMWSTALNGTGSADHFSVKAFENYYNQQLLAPNPATSATIHAISYLPGTDVQPSGNYVHQRITGVVPNTVIANDPVTFDPPSWATAIHQPGRVGGAFADTEVMSAALLGNRLVFAAGYGITSVGDTDPRMALRVIELNTSASTGVVKQDFLLSEPGASFVGGSVAFAANGDLHIGFNRSSDTDYLSSWAVYQPAGATPNTVSARTLLTEASSTYGFDDWGAVFTGATDPLVPDQAWLAVEDVTGSGTWRTTVWSMSTATGDTYVPVPPIRILDTRTGTGLTDPFFNSVPRTFNVAGAGGGAIPADAVAITGNLTVANQQSAGYVSAGPTIGPNPTTSTINFPFGDDRANNVTLPLDANGDLTAVFKGPPSKFTDLILDITGYYLADASGATYEPVTSVRKLDTRNGTGLSGKFQVDAPRSFQVTGGSIPAGAIAVTGNLTVVGQTKRGYVSLTPAANANPTTSTINFPLGDTRANGVTVPLSPTGKVWAVYKATTAGTTDLIFDVNGYYVDGTSGLRFFPLNPGRIMDTRTSALTQLSGAFSSSVPRTLVTGGHFGVPGDALAVTGNLTVVGQTAGGYVSITKDPTASPAVSTLNFPAGDVRANGATVPLNAANDMALVYKATSGARTHLILDLTGYFR